MMTLYSVIDQRISSQLFVSGQALSEDLVWLDLLQPTREEEETAEAFLGLDIPTQEEMKEIEVSNRLYEENDALFMTSTMLTKVNSGAPETHAVTFIVTKKRLITVRYVDTTSFRRFSSLFMKLPAKRLYGVPILLSLLEAVVNRKADILERVDRDIDRITRGVFSHKEKDPKKEVDVDYQQVLEQIGRCGDINAKIHESLATFSRVIVFAGQHPWFTKSEYELQLTSLRRDIAGLSDHGNHLAARVNFLLDATLGMISIEQNNIFKLLAVASLVLMPPTLIAGIYGMNFKLLPELEWHWGYPLALLLMLFSAILPVAYLRQKKWL